MSEKHLDSILNNTALLGKDVKDLKNKLQFIVNNQIKLQNNIISLDEKITKLLKQNSDK